MGRIQKYTGKLTSRQVNWLISLFLSAVSFAVYLMADPLPISKYRLSLSNDKPIQTLNNAFFDLDHDGRSEHLLFKDYHNFPGIEITDLDNKFIEVLTITGKWLNTVPDYLVCDTDQDGYNEIFTITLNNDSLLLNGFEPLGDDEHFLVDKFIDITPKKEGRNNITVEQVISDDMDLDGRPEVIFILSAGYTLYPRKVYRFNPATRSIDSTPQLGAKPIQFVLSDIDGDGFKELILATTATENFPGNTIVPFNDYSAYILGFTHSLDSLVLAKEFDKEKPSLSCMARKENTDVFIYVLFYGFITNRNQLLKYDRHGELRATLDIEGRGSFRFLFPELDVFPEFYLRNGRTIFVTDTALSMIKIKKESYVPVTQYFDASRVFGEELRFWINENEMLITDKRLKDYASLSSGFSEGFQYKLYFLEKEKGSSVRLAGQDPSGRVMYFQVRENHLFPFRVGLWGLVFILLFLFFSLMLRIQSYYAQRRLKNEMQLQSLQLSYVQNQLHPHFTFNVLNNIGALIRSGQNEVGYHYLSKFSDMLRVVLLKSDSHSWRIGDEINFIHSYLAIENLRFNNRFRYAVTVNEELTSRHIPRLMVQAFVENSIRHGLMHKTGDCRLDLRLEDMGLATEVIIEDNGIGREASAGLSRESTGKGIQILADFIAVYNKLNEEEFSLEIIDLYHDSGEAAGTRVRLLIPVNYQ